MSETASPSDNYDWRQSMLMTMMSLLADLTNVNNTSPTDGQVLTWDNANSYWKPASAASGGSDTFIRYSEYTAASTPHRTQSPITGSTSSSRYGWSGQGGTLDQTWAVTSLSRCRVEHQVECHHLQCWLVNLSSRHHKQHWVFYKPVVWNN